ncbi:acylphosphatase [Candidatus Berkelbacteria bacterium RIFCSPHIGHO2_12_FULL_36_9]|uniref:acylphosphatase n=1 Tax=Candidatus Berkelbacteria bacterium RIFCSPHIGHO2_12_FULL_36_9 TaxID=1797469 RepID=A0A1F5EKK6_9BACT|nr:MAG: acylphosphatase [Candidatus Berkelbacteria bacterium RIFCSPHIGHO2_12_FULL_36_9]
MKRIHLLILGNVQGVGFRYNVRQKVMMLGLVGTVENLPDGSVEIVAEGEEEKLQELVKWCKSGYHYAKIDNIKVDWQKAERTYNDFEIKY